MTAWLNSNKLLVVKARRITVPLAFVVFVALSVGEFAFEDMVGENPNVLSRRAS